MILALFLFGIVIFICIIVLITIVSTVRINIEKLKISNNYKKVKKNIICKIEIYIIGKFKINIGYIDNNKFKKLYEKSKKSYEKIENGIIFSRKGIKNIKRLNLKIIQYNMNLQIGTPNVILTSFIVVAISSAVSYILSNNIKIYDESNYKYIIEPVYVTRNSIDFELSTILEFKVIDIIYFLITSIKYNKKQNNLKTKNKLSFES